jgi:hypothetical protein
LRAKVGDVASQRSALVRLAAVAAVIAVLVTTFAAFTIGDDDDDAAATTSTTSTSLSTEDLGPGARQLVDLLQAARESTYHARYEGTSPDAPDTVIRLETWQSPPRVRQDSELQTGGQLARTSSFVLPDGSVRCTRIGDSAWSCRPAAAGELQRDVISESVLQQLQDADVHVRSTEIDDVDVTCFTLTSTDGTSDLCLDAQGVTVRVQSHGSELRRVEMSDDVTDDVFEPPVAA